jgi:hypothetical protein
MRHYWFPIWKQAKIGVRKMGPAGNGRLMPYVPVRGIELVERNLEIFFKGK